MTELNEITAFMQRFDTHIDCKHAIGYDDSLGKQIKVTILASGFGIEDEPDDIDIYGDIEEMQILIHADDFLHNMARIIIGTLMDIGLGNRSVQDIDDIFAGILEASAPCDPKGLYLQEIP